MSRTYKFAVHHSNKLLKQRSNRSLRKLNRSRLAKYREDTVFEDDPVLFNSNFEFWKYFYSRYSEDKMIQIVCDKVYSNLQGILNGSIHHYLDDFFNVVFGKETEFEEYFLYKRNKKVRQFYLNNRVRVRLAQKTTQEQVLEYAKRCVHLGKIMIF